MFRGRWDLGGRLADEQKLAQQNGVIAANATAAIAAALTAPATTALAGAESRPIPAASDGHAANVAGQESAPIAESRPIGGAQIPAGDRDSGQADQPVSTSTGEESAKSQYVLTAPVGPDSPAPAALLDDSSMPLPAIDSPAPAIQALQARLPAAAAGTGIGQSEGTLAEVLAEALDVGDGTAPTIDQLLSGSLGSEPAGPIAIATFDDTLVPIETGEPGSADGPVALAAIDLAAVPEWGIPHLETFDMLTMIHDAASAAGAGAAHV